MQIYLKGNRLMRIIVTGGAIILDPFGRILFQRRSDYGNWGLPGGGMKAGETVEETMIREVFEETGLEVSSYELYAIYSGPRMNYQYPDGNEVSFVMFVFNAEVILEDKLSDDGKRLLYEDSNGETLQLEFFGLNDINLLDISTVQRPLIEDLRNNIKTVLRT